MPQDSDRREAGRSAHRVQKGFFFGGRAYLFGSISVSCGVQVAGKQSIRAELPKENVQAEVSRMEKADGSHCFRTASSLLANEQAYGKVGAFIVAVRAGCFWLLIGTVNLKDIHIIILSYSLLARF